MKFPNTIHSKLPKAGISIFAKMSRLSDETGAINLSQGFPEFDAPDALKALVTKHMKKGMNQYASMLGVLPLREAIAEEFKKNYNTVYDPETEINITAGATQAIFTALASVIQEGDEVIVLEPAYDSYVPAITLNGGIPVYLELKAPDYSIDWDGMRKLINPRTRMIMLNTPHNPTGSILSAEDIKKLEQITKNTDIIILSDEVYERIIFDGSTHQSMARYPKLAERSFIIGSLSKVFSATGWKIGYCVAPENLMSEFRKVHQFVVFCVNSAVQYAMAEYMQKPEALDGVAEMYQERRDKFLKLVKKTRFTCIPSSGSYFQLLNYKNISDEAEVAFAERLTREHGVATIPISVFYHKNVENKVLRFCFAKSDETLEKAIERLCKI
ncbi:MAG: methionine aminotransferase [Bacteroidota bacterium]